MSSKPGCIETVSGLEVNPLTLSPDDLRIGDITVSLSNICRFNGSVAIHYSVAQHSLLVCDLTAAILEPLVARQLRAQQETFRRQALLTALLHDAAEVYIGDVMRPLQGFLKQWKPAEIMLTRTILRRFGAQTGGEVAGIVDIADNAALLLEAQNLKRSRGIGWGLLPATADDSRYWVEPVDALEARAGFFNRFQELFKEPARLRAD